MKMPEIDAIIEWRLLVNYRVDAEVAARLLPAPFRPQLVDGWARGRHLRHAPRPFEASRSAHLPRAEQCQRRAHRFAVEWDRPDGAVTGVYIPRRDTGSALNSVIGGRFFPGDYRRARFSARDAAVSCTFPSREATSRSERLPGGLSNIGLRAADAGGPHDLARPRPDAVGPAHSGDSALKGQSRVAMARIVIPRWHRLPRPSSGRTTRCAW